ncbi:hypothetical protein CEXT_295501 [Caerostris extrusa]|uniref:DUF4773 domain-containing protein n=1 Tax=Caerostris extrusa TaxID=172846 RepID=A0AAV4WTC1_CAEEX|nr:hypothetical protein CEXT_295501 [Caerostris extrusa]
MKSLLSAAVILFITLCYALGAEVSRSNFRDSSYGCVCQNYTCGCCAHIEAPRVGLNDTGLCKTLCIVYFAYSTNQYYLKKNLDSVSLNEEWIPLLLSSHLQIKKHGYFFTPMIGWCLCPGVCHLICSSVWFFHHVDFGSSPIQLSCQACPVLEC